MRGGGRLAARANEAGYAAGRFCARGFFARFPSDRWIGIVQQAKNIRALITYFDQRTGGEPQDFEWNLKNLQIHFRL